MSQIAISTSQNVNIQYNVASVGERIVAFLIDLVIKAAYVLVLYSVLNKFFNLGTYFDSMDQWSIMAVMIMITLPIHVYTLVLESLMEGQTFGKKIMKIKVVKIDGYQAGFGDYLIRWIFRLVDVFSNSGVVGLITMIVNRNNQRLGDIASGTAVISLKNAIGISHTILEHLHEDYQGTFPQVVALSDNDVRIIKENFQKAMKVDDRQIITALANKIRQTLKMEAEPKGLTERQFIKTIIRDYSYYTGTDL
ncbi:MAG: RDD family protein [Weeksellaceae bacterium]|nr:RDD family protein [Weeksellaceae bacterium]